MAGIVCWVLLTKSPSLIPDINPLCLSWTWRTLIFLFTRWNEHVKCLLQITASSLPQSKACLQPHRELIRLYAQDPPAYSCPVEQLQVFVHLAFEFKELVKLNPIVQHYSAGGTSFLISWLFCRKYVGNICGFSLDKRWFRMGFF